jgi:hypothetical protein
MSLKLFQYYLLEEDGRSNYISNGIVTTRGIPTPLPQTPDGWQGILLAWERNMAKQGIVRAYSKELGYVLDGAMILRDAFYKGSIDRKLYLLCQKLTLEYAATYRWVYKYLFKVEVDMTTIKDGEDIVKASLMEGGLSKMLKANENTVYSIPFDDDAINITHTGLKLFNSFKILLLENGSGVSNFAGMVHTSQDENKKGGTGVAVFDIAKTLNVGSPDLEVLYFGEVRLDGRAVFSGRFTLNPLETDVVISLQVYNNGVFRTQVNTSALGLPAGSDYDYLETIQLIKGDRLYFIVSFFYLETTLTMDWDVVYPTSTYKAFLRKDLFRKLIAKICGYEDYAVSELLANGDRAITCGDAIRGFDDAVIKVSLNDFFEDVDTDLMAGMGIEPGAAAGPLIAGDRVVIEARDHFYDFSSPINIGEPSSRPNVTYTNDIAFNRVKTGWAKTEVEDTNGRYSFNGSQQWTLPLLRINKEYKLTSPFSADPYEIEWARINLDGKTTTDSSRDNKNYVLVVEMVTPGEYRLKRDATQAGSDPDTFGVPDPATIFNIDLSPKRKLLRHKRWIRSILHNYPNEKIIQQSAETNGDIITTVAGLTVDENADIPVEDLGLPMFLPYYFDFEAKSPVNLFELLEANTNRCFQFTWEGVTYYGFLIKAGMAPNTSEKQEFKLLATPQNDMTNLI